MTRPRLYLIGPITHGDRAANYEQAWYIQLTFMAAGFAVLNPMHTIVAPNAFDVPHAVWMEQALAWLECAEVAFVLPYEVSDGADEEIAFCEEHDISVFTRLPDLKRWLDT